MAHTRTLLRFRFIRAGDADKVQQDLSVALFCAEGLYGSARLRIECAHTAAEDGGRCVIESRGDAGDIVQRLMATFCAERLGEDGFQIERIDPSAQERRA